MSQKDSILLIKNEPAQFYINKVLVLGFRQKKKSITLTSKITGTGTNTLHKQSISSWIRVACVYYRHYI